MLAGCSWNYDAPACEEPVAELYNVEPFGFHSLGSIPVDSSELLTRTDLSQLGEDAGQFLLQPTGPQLPGFPSPVPTPKPERD